ncbi:MAG: RNA ligase family protein [Rhizomicrobium sp.]
MTKPAKPLGRKGYGSIPHLPNSRLGSGDWSIGTGQAAILCEKKRDRHDRIIVTEKLDGSCVTIANIDGTIVPITRAGYHAADSHYLQHHRFGTWVRDRAAQIAAALPPGSRIAGEWLAQAHGTRYLIAAESDLFVAFDVLAGTDRWPHDEARTLFGKCDLRSAAVLSDGDAFPIDAAMAALGPTGHHGAWDEVEGAVWRCETRGVFNFIAKFVRPEKVDGKYLAGVTGGADVWNWAFGTPLEHPLWQGDAE